jgi:hypothetical protein
MHRLTEERDERFAVHGVPDYAGGHHPEIDEGIV